MDQKIRQARKLLYRLRHAKDAEVLFEFEMLLEDGVRLKDLHIDEHDLRDVIKKAANDTVKRLLSATWLDSQQYSPTVTLEQWQLYRLLKTRFPIAIDPSEENAYRMMAFTQEAERQLENYERFPTRRGYERLRWLLLDGPCPVMSRVALGAAFELLELTDAEYEAVLQTKLKGDASEWMDYIDLDQVVYAQLIIRFVECNLLNWEKVRKNTWAHDWTFEQFKQQYQRAD